MRRPLPLLILLQAVISAASLVVEIVAGRMLAPYVGMSLYTWTSVIAVVLAGFSAGHWWGGYVAERPARRALRLTAWIILAAAVTTGGALMLLRVVAGPVIAQTADPVWAIVALTFAVFFLPSLFAGVPSPVLAHIAATRAAGEAGAGSQGAGRALGAMFAASALGAIAGTLLAGFVFIPWLGTALTLAAVTVTYVVAAAALFALGGGRISPMWPLILAGLALALGAVSATQLSPCTRESQYYCIRVIDVSAEAGTPARLMVLDHLSHGTSARDRPQVMYTEFTAMIDALARRRMAGREFSAFFIGGGTYSVPRAWAERGTGPITVAEIDPAVTETAIASFWLEPDGMTILHEDARRALLRRPERYDVIVGDAFTDIAVPAHLVTREFFELVASRLEPDGVYLMNIIDHVDGLRALAAIVRTLREVFPVVEIWAEPNPAGSNDRLVFIVLAGQTPTPSGMHTGPAPDFTRAARLSPQAAEALVARLDPPVLTDDYAPIDRLMTRFD